MLLQKQMGHAYQQCVEERGKGSFARMKDHMHRHTYEVRSMMFSTATRAPLL